LLVYKTATREKETEKGGATVLNVKQI